MINKEDILKVMRAGNRSRTYKKGYYNLQTRLNELIEKEENNVSEELLSVLGRIAKALETRG